VEEVGDDPRRSLLLEADRAGILLEVVVMDRPRGPAVTYAMRMQPRYERWLNQIGEAATATREEEGLWGSVPFADIPTPAKIEGGWRIVDKASAHTGGAPPRLQARR
jgi:hypothetical protein